MEKTGNSFNNSDYLVLSLDEVVKGIGEEGYHELISDFSCQHDVDLESFLKEKSLTYQKADYYGSKTYLVGFVGIEKFQLCGYFTLVNKPFVFNENISKSKKRHLTEGETNRNAISAILIGQLSKNYTAGKNLLLTGEDLLTCALGKIKLVYQSVGVELIYVECTNNDKLKYFYEKNGFTLYVDKDGNPILNKSKLLCYIAKAKNLISM